MGITYYCWWRSTHTPTHPYTVTTHTYSRARPTDRPIPRLMTRRAFPASRPIQSSTEDDAPTVDVVFCTKLLGRKFRSGLHDVLICRCADTYQHTFIRQPLFLLCVCVYIIFSTILTPKMFVRIKFCPSKISTIFPQIIYEIFCSYILSEVVCGPLLV